MPPTNEERLALIKITAQVDDSFGQATSKIAEDSSQLFISSDAKVQANKMTLLDQYGRALETLNTKNLAQLDAESAKQSELIAKLHEMLGLREKERTAAEQSLDKVSKSAADHSKKLKNFWGELFEDIVKSNEGLTGMWEANGAAIMKGFNVFSAGIQLGIAGAKQLAEAQKEAAASFSAVITAGGIGGTINRNLAVEAERAAWSAEATLNLSTKEARGMVAPWVASGSLLEGGDAAALTKRLALTSFAGAQTLGVTGEALAQGATGLKFLEGTGLEEGLVRMAGTARRAQMIMEEGIMPASQYNQSVMELWRSTVRYGGSQREAEKEVAQFGEELGRQRLTLQDITQFYTSFQRASPEQAAASFAVPEVSKELNNVIQKFPEIAKSLSKYTDPVERATMAQLIAADKANPLYNEQFTKDLNVSRFRGFEAWAAAQAGGNEAKQLLIEQKAASAFGFGELTPATIAALRRGIAAEPALTEKKIEDTTKEAIDATNQTLADLRSAVGGAAAGFKALTMALDKTARTIGSYSMTEEGRRAVRAATSGGTYTAPREKAEVVLLPKGKNQEGGLSVFPGMTSIAEAGPEMVMPAGVTARYLPELMAMMTGGHTGRSGGSAINVNANVSIEGRMDNSSIARQVGDEVSRRVFSELERMAINSGITDAATR